MDQIKAPVRCCMVSHVLTLADRLDLSTLGVCVMQTKSGSGKSMEA